MPRPKQGVTPANMLKVDNYFARALRFDRLRGKGWFENEAIYAAAKRHFQNLPNINWTNKLIKKTSAEKRRRALQQWIDEYISEEKWQRCLLTLRQDKSRKKLDLKQLSLTADVYRTVKIIAEKKGITMGEVIRKLAEPMLHKIYKSEVVVETKLNAKKKITVK